MPANTLFGKTLSELSGLAAGLGMPRFAAGQMASWLYRRRVDDIALMSDLSLGHRQALSENYIIGLTAPSQVSVSGDGTKKYLFRTCQGSAIESALIPDRDRATLCLSSQAGCRMGCKFCATGRQGFAHNLATGEILNQIASLPERDSLTNIVYMGMGEPLDNIDNVLRSLEILTAPWGIGMSPSRITVSTAGMTENLKLLLDGTSVHIAVSLHNPVADQRAQIMPIQISNPIEEIVELLARYDFTRQRRLSFEYILMEGLNDSPAHIKELCRLLNRVKCRINLIRFHAIPGSPFRSPSHEKMVAFRDALTRKGIMTTIRASRGEDIEAACGLLSTIKS